jgi:type IV secretion system protein VirD4
MSKFSRLSREALFLGRTERQGHRRRARGPADALPGADEAVLCPGGQAPHLLTIAPNRSSRDRSCLVPNLLNYAGQVVVLDIDGRAYAATAAARRALGQYVMRLDPFGVTGPEPAPDTYTAPDWIEGGDGAVLTRGCREVAELFSRGPSLGDADESEAIGLLSAILGYLYVVPEKKINENELYVTLHSEDIIYSLAVVLDTIGKRLTESTYAEIASFLQKDDRARTCILARATSLLKVFSSLDVAASTDGSTFKFPSDQPATVYIIVPAERVKIYAPLLRVWIGGMLRTTLRAPDPAVPALFLLDHCAELMPFPQLAAAHATAPAGKLRLWTFWHDVSQLRAAYARDWPAMIAGCGAVQVFGTSDPEAAAEAATILGLPPDDIRSLGTEDQIVRLDGVPRRLHRLGT